MFSQVVAWKITFINQSLKRKIIQFHTSSKTMASKYQAKIIKEYESNGYGVIKLAKTNKNGIADLLVSKKDVRPILIEVKEKNDTLKKLQIAQNLIVARQMDFEFIVLQDGIGQLEINSESYKTNLF
jgi:hypothetical protein